MLWETWVMLHRIALSEWVTANCCPQLSYFIEKLQTAHLVLGWNSPCNFFPFLYKYFVINNISNNCSLVLLVRLNRCGVTVLPHLAFEELHHLICTWQSPPQSITLVHSDVHLSSLPSHFIPFRTDTNILRFCITAGWDDFLFISWAIGRLCIQTCNV